MQIIPSHLELELLYHSRSVFFNLANPNPNNKNLIREWSE